MSHKFKSASATKFWWHCPGALAYLQAHPVPDSYGYHAKLGTAAHHLLEICLTTGNRPVAYLGQNILVGESETRFEVKAIGRLDDVDVFEVDADMVEAVEVATTYTNDRLRDEGLHHSDLYLEKQVNPLPGNDSTGGTGDIIIDAWPDYLEIIDYKHGQGVHVPVANNYQLRSYALGAVHLFKAWDEYKYVKYTIVQPRHPQGGVESEEMTIEELKAWQGELQNASDRVDEACDLVRKTDASLDDLSQMGYLTTGSDASHCTFCKVKAQCPEMKSLATKTAMIEFDDEPATSIPVPTQADQLAKAAKWAPIIKAWTDSVMASVANNLTRGIEIEGQKLVAGRAIRAWDNSIEKEDIASILVDDYGIDPEKVMIEQNPKMITGPQAEKLVPKKLRKEFNAKLLYRKEGKLTVVPESDKRPAIVLNPADDFDD